ncbi:MAG: ROK family protein [Bifidobacteriaceae bacterium]|nr:ROK family protein [Bifidobacteriaceae bacterium]
MATEPAATLCVDCGGGGIKAGVLDAAGTLHGQPVRIPTPYPLTPARLVEAVGDLAASLPAAGRLTLGLPGMIRHGLVVWTPHYVNRGGPWTRQDPDLVQAWTGCDLQAALSASLGMPSLVVNDAELHGAGVVAGTGVELVLTFGTGLGTALFDGGRLAPHLEVSHAPIRRGVTFDEYIGERHRRTLGNPVWSRRVRRVVEALRPVFLWDRLYIGGGNSRLLTPTTLAQLTDEVVVVPNSAAIMGGARAWELYGG